MFDYLSVIAEWQRIILARSGVSRYLEAEIAETMDSKPVKVITGFRRSGKSFLAGQIARKMVETGKLDPGNLLYLNFEDYSLETVRTPQDLAYVFELFLTNSASASGTKLLILDEIQNVPGWESFIRTIYEKHSNLEIILTGSNSRLLSAELGSSLAGRFIEFFLLPFSFREFLEYKKMCPGSRLDYLGKKREIHASFEEYLKTGGLPETFDIGRFDTRLSYLKGVINKVVLDDIIKRFKIDNIQLFESLLGFILSSPGQIISFASIKRKAESLGIHTTTETVLAFVSYLQKSFTVFPVSKFGWKQTSVFESTKKYYAIDTGLLSVYRNYRENYSFRLENAVFLELLRRNKGPVYFGADESGKEIDFLCGSREQGWSAWQITAALTEENRTRELDSFLRSDRYLSGTTNTLLALDVPGTQELRVEGTTVHISNLVEWLLFGAPDIPHQIKVGST